MNTELIVPLLAAAIQSGTPILYATLGEIRLAVGEPDLDLGNVETALEALRSECYYLTA